jgi:hypothetical protein
MKLPYVSSMTRLLFLMLGASLLLASPALAQSRASRSPKLLLQGGTHLYTNGEDAQLDIIEFERLPNAKASEVQDEEGEDGDVTVGVGVQVPVTDRLDLRANASYGFGAQENCPTPVWGNRSFYAVGVDAALPMPVGSNAHRALPHLLPASVETRFEVEPFVGVGLTYETYEDEGVDNGTYPYLTYGSTFIYRTTPVLDVFAQVRGATFIIGNEEVNYFGLPLDVDRGNTTTVTVWFGVAARLK